MGQKICYSCMESKQQVNQVQVQESENPLHIKPDEQPNPYNFDIPQINRQLDSVLQQFLQYLHQEKEIVNFEILVNKPECIVSSCQIDEGFIIKYQFHIPFDPKSLINFLSDVQNRPKWDSNVKSSRILYDSADLRIIHTVYKGFLTISPRESLMASKKVQIGGCIIDINKSIICDTIPVQEGNVRVQVYFGGYYYQRIPKDENGNVALVTGISLADFGFTPALAKIARAFTVTAMPRFTKNLIKAVRESGFPLIMFLQQLNGHQNIIKLLDVIRAQNDQDIYLIFDFMQTDLHAVIRANILQDIHKRYIIYQICKAIKFMHSGQLLHRNLKPSNILINSQCLVKVADFGCSVAAYQQGSNSVLTDYVATRQNRAPQILLGSTKYSKVVDMWSLGCILAEMIAGKPVFPGTSTLNQLDRVLELIGRPSEEDARSIQSNLAANILDSLPPTTAKFFHSFFPSAADDALDLIRSLLQFNPEKRITVEEALAHRYMSQFHNPTDEPECPRVIRISIDVNRKFTIRDYREKIYQNISRKKGGLGGRI